ncbi:MAG: bifunctional diguanylate cyclase/phosphodiesterase [Pseudomonas sp.]|nr:MAG: bifunctional diguanylate cyclase/phosphodiesterase [Pseudomonas sp.]
MKNTGQSTSTAAASESEVTLVALNKSFATLMLDGSGRILDTNELWLQQLGYAKESLSTINLFSVTFPLDKSSKSIQEIWQELGKGNPQSLYIQRLDAKGTRHWRYASYTPLADHDGKMHRILEISKDVGKEISDSAEERGQIRAIRQSYGVAKFSTDGVIMDANELFLQMMGYSLHEIQGQPHRMLVDPQKLDEENDIDFWQSLQSGQFYSNEVGLTHKEGHKVWLRATYNPIANVAGQIKNVLLYAIDVTREKNDRADFQWQIDAIRKSHCVISFDPQGIILEANDQFLSVMGYAPDEVIGRHHRMFVDATYLHSEHYARFWRELGQGHHQSGEFCRVDKQGRDVWLNANYSPVFDSEGVLIKVVKYATVITDEKTRQADHQGQIAAIHQSQAVVSFDMTGRVLDANDNFLRMTGFKLKEVQGVHHRFFIGTSDAELQDNTKFWGELATGRFQAGEFKLFGKNVKEIWVQATYNPIIDHRGRPIKVVKYAADITAQKVKQSYFQSHMEAIEKSQGIITFALDGTILEANSIMLGILGYEFSELFGKNHRMLLDPEHAAHEDYEAFWQTLRRGEFIRGRHQRVGRDGRRIWLQASYNPVYDLNGTLTSVVKFATDVSADVALAEAYEDAQRQAQHDPATSLPNRSRLASFMTAVLSHQNARCAVIYLDLDGFKPVNDTYGHAMGDKVLAEVADRLRRSLNGDQLVARVGGDEFVIVAPGMSEEEADAYCSRVQDAISMPVHREHGEVFVGASMGIAMAPADGKHPDDLLRAADSALYRVKQNGRKAHSFYATVTDTRFAMTRKLVDQMRHGIDANEFFLQFQPRFETKTRTMRSAEALVRWRHPDQGLMPPDAFISVAEKSGLIVPLGDWVLHTACAAAASWPESMGVSVNVSPVQFKDEDLVHKIRACLQVTRLDPARLEIELTEGVLIDDAQRAQSALRQIKDLGVKIAIDDFGTGYSSLSYLRDFPFDVIKIDRKFISGIDHDASTRNIVRAILSLAKAMNLSVTAEGVETEAQLSILSADECSEIQGFLLGRPMDQAQLVGFMQAGRAHLH